MENMSSREALTIALSNTLSGDFEVHQAAIAFIQQVAQQAGFAGTLMEIINDSCIHVDIKYAALIRIKNHIKIFWKSNTNQICDLQKETIMRTIIPTIIHSDRRLMRKFKEVLTLVVEFQQKTWLPPVDQILIRINKEEENFAVLFHILIAIAKGFKKKIPFEEGNQFIKAALPPVLNIINKLQDNELTYLGIKFLKNVVDSNINNEIRDLVCEWMPLLLEVVNSSNSQFDRHPKEIQEQYSAEFFYFHSKKWANRIFLRFIQIYTALQAHNRNRRFRNRWYTQYGQPYIQILLNKLSVKTMRKIHYFQLQALNNLILKRPDLLEHRLQAFVYDILTNFMRMQPQDQQLVCSRPLEIINMERRYLCSSEQIKLAATLAWLSFSTLGRQNKGLVYKPGVYFYQNINYIQSKLQKMDLIQKQLGMYLLYRTHHIIVQGPKAKKKILPILITKYIKYIIPELRSSIVLIRARALDILSQEKTIQWEDETIKEIFQGVCDCLIKDQYAIVRIKATYAFKSIIKHAKVKELIRPQIEIIISAFFQIIQNFQISHTVGTLRKIVQLFTAQISPFVKDIVQRIAFIFFKSFHKDVEKFQRQKQFHKDFDSFLTQKNNDGDEMICAECVWAITGIVYCQIPQDIIISIEPTVIRLTDFIFGEANSDYLYDGLSLLNAYLKKCKKMSGQIWFYCQAVVYSIVGIPVDMQAIIDQLPLPAYKRKMLRHVQNGQINYVGYSIYVLRNYIQKVYEMRYEPSFLTIMNNFVSLFLYLFEGVYKKERYINIGPVDIICCNRLMIYLFQSFKSSLPEEFVKIAWGYFIHNLSFNQIKINIINSQLLGMLLWTAPSLILHLAHSQNMFDILLGQITAHQRSYESDYQRTRIILGINSLLLFANQSPEVEEGAPTLFQALLKLIQKNVNSRLHEDQPNIADDDSSESEQSFYGHYGEGQEISLMHIDEIDEFRKTIEQIRTENSIIYQRLLQSVSAEELNILDDNIFRAIQAGKTDNAK